MEKACCFVGYRKVENKGLVFSKAKKVIEELVRKKGVRVFYFGSRNEFDEGCHQIVTALQAEYPDIERVHYHCNSQSPVKKEGKASYAEHNEEMIDDSEYCVFYYLEEYRPQGNARSVSSGKSGTKLAYEYAASKKKTIFDIVEGEE